MTTAPGLVETVGEGRWKAEIPSDSHPETYGMARWQISRDAQQWPWPGRLLGGLGGLLLGVSVLAGAAAVPGFAEPVQPIPSSSSDAFLVRHWTTHHGLPQNTVLCLAQARDGYLWLGTRYGLVRYDGMRFAVFFEELAGAAPGATDCRHLVADVDGTLWVHTRGGLFAYRERAFSRQVPVDAAGVPFPVDTVAGCRSGGIWLGGSAGVVRFSAGKLGPVIDRRQGVRGEPVTEIFEDRSHRLWLQFAVGLRRTWQRFDPATGEVRALESFLPPEGGASRGQRRELAWESVTEDRVGRLWLGLPEALVRIDGEEVVRFPADGLWAGEAVRQLLEDRDGNVWVVTEGKAPLHRFNGKRLETMSRLGGVALEPDLRSLLADREGNLWAGSGSAGVYRIHERQLLAQLHVTDSARDEVFSVAVAAAGTLWLGTQNGLQQLGPNGWKSYHEPGATTGPRVKPVLVDRSGQVWGGVLGSGLGRLEGEVFQSLGIKAPGSDGNWKVRALFEDRDGSLWVGSDHGLLRRRHGEFEWLPVRAGFPAHAVVGILQDREGALWFGTEGDGIHVLANDQWRAFRRRDGLRHNHAWPLAAEPEGAVWVGTPLGLNRVDATGIRSVTTRQGLPDNLAYCLLEDDRGWYWSSCNRGLWRMRRSELNAVADGRASHVSCVSYDESDGMESAEVNGDEQPSAARRGNGELWFPTTRGVVIANPALLREQDVAPMPVVEELLADGRPLTVKSRSAAGVDGGVGSPQPRLHVGAGQARVLELRYSAPSFLDAERLRFRYRLRGHDESWQEVGGRRVAFYTGLEPGRYAFEVLAGNHHGYWSPAPATVEFELAPYFWQTWRFRALLASGVGLGLLGLHAARVRYLRRIQGLEQRQVLETERHRIAKDLHDDLGAGLAGIALQLELAQQQARSGDVTGPLLDRVKLSARKLVDQLREVVWALNPKCDTLDNLVTFLCQYAEDFLEDAQVRLRLSIPTRLPRQFLSAEVRHNLVLAVKEALNNAVQHGSPTEVRLELQLEGPGAVLRVQDNGTGFDPTTGDAGSGVSVGARGGSGLHNLRRRLADIGGRCEIVSASGAGTTVSLIFPLDTASHDHPHRPH